MYVKYGKKNIEDIDEVQTQIFVEKYRQRDVNERLKFISKFDGSMIPPSGHTSEFLQKRSNEHVFIVPISVVQT